VTILTAGEASTPMQQPSDARALHRHTTCQLVLATCQLMLNWHTHARIYKFFACSDIQIVGVVTSSGGAAKAVTQNPSIADGT